MRENLDINARFKDAPWYNTTPNILIGGAGGIGGNTLYCLAKSVPGIYYVVDDDVVSTHNVGTQFFRKSDIDKKKVNALQTSMNEFTTSAILPVHTKMTSTTKLPIMIAAFDNMEARKYSFELWKSQSNRELYIDGRLRASFYEIFVVIPGREEEYEKTLFSDNEGDEGSCTFKQTAYFGMLIGARITQMVVNYLTNKSIGEEVCQLPFHIRELGEAVFIQISNNGSLSE